MCGLKHVAAGLAVAGLGCYAAWRGTTAYLTAEIAGEGSEAGQAGMILGGITAALGSLFAWAWSGGRDDVQ